LDKIYEILRNALFIDIFIMKLAVWLTKGVCFNIRYVKLGIN